MFPFLPVASPLLPWTVSKSRVQHLRISCLKNQNQPFLLSWVLASCDNLLKAMPFSLEGFPGGSGVKSLPALARDVGSILGSGKIPWRRKWQPTPVFLPGKFHRQRSPEGYGPQDCNESDTTGKMSKRACTNTRWRLRRAMPQPQLCPS